MITVTLTPGGPNTEGASRASIQVKDVTAAESNAALAQDEPNGVMDHRSKKQAHAVLPLEPGDS